MFFFCNLLGSYPGTSSAGFECIGAIDFRLETTGSHHVSTSETALASFRSDKRIEYKLQTVKMVDWLELFNRMMWSATQSKLVNFSTGRVYCGGIGRLLGHHRPNFVISKLQALAEKQFVIIILVLSAGLLIPTTLVSFTDMLTGGITKTGIGIIKERFIGQVCSDPGGQGDAFNKFLLSRL